MQGRVCMVTGATNGIGEITALELARLGATVVIVGRNEDKAKATISKIKSSVPNADVAYLIADLSLMRDVKKLAETFLATYDRLDVLVNNAGMVFEKQEKTAEGLEKTFALNHMNYFYLTHLLLDILKASGTPTQKARIVNVASIFHRMWKINFDDPQNEKGYMGLRAYGYTKCMNIMHAYELHRRLASENANVTVNSLHPGGVRTGFSKNNHGWTRYFIAFFNFLYVTPEKGAQTSIYLASSPQSEGMSGHYFYESKPQKSNAFSRDEANWSKLWQYSEDTLQKLALDI